MRELDFTGDDAKERYEITYEGLVGTNRGFEAPSETRVIGKILDKLEAIGTPSPTASGVLTFTLNDGGGKVYLEEEEFKLAGECIRLTKWKAQISRKATAAVEWFMGIPKMEPKKDEAKEA